MKIVNKLPLALALVTLFMVNLDSFAKRTRRHALPMVQQQEAGRSVVSEEIIAATDDVKTATAKAQIAIADAEQKISLIRDQLKTGDISPVDAAKKIGEYNYIIEREKKQLAERVDADVEKVESVEAQESYLNQFISGAKSLGSNIIAPFKSGYGYSEKEQAIARAIITELQAQLKEIEEGSILAQQQAKTQEEKKQLKHEYNNIKETIKEEIRNQQVITGEVMSRNRKLFWIAVGLAGAVAAGSTAQYYLTKTDLPTPSPEVSQIQTAKEPVVAEGFVAEKALEGNIIPTPSTPTSEPISTIEVSSSEPTFEKPDQDLISSDSSTKSAAERIIWPAMEQAEREAQLAREEQIQQQLEKRAQSEQIAAQQLNIIKKIPAQAAERITAGLEKVKQTISTATEEELGTPEAKYLGTPEAREELRTRLKKGISSAQQRVGEMYEESMNKPTASAAERVIWPQMEQAEQAAQLAQQEKIKQQLEKRAQEEQIAAQQFDTIKKISTQAAENINAGLGKVKQTISTATEEELGTPEAEYLGTPESRAALRTQVKEGVNAGLERVKQMGDAISESSLSPKYLETSEEELGTPDAEYLGTPESRAALRTQVKKGAGSVQQKLSEIYEEGQKNPTESAAERIIWPQMKQDEWAAQFEKRQKEQQQLEKRARDEKIAAEQLETLKKISDKVK